MSWYGLGVAVLFLILCFGLLAMWAWPRNQDGSLMNMDDATEVMNKFPSPGLDLSAKKKVVLVFILAVATLAVALTKHANPQTVDDHDSTL